MNIKASSVLIGCFGIFVCCAVCSCHKWGEHEARTMLERAKAQHTAVDLQRAVRTLYSQYPTNSDVPVNQLPKEILSLSSDTPSDSYVDSVGTEKKWTLTVFWGGGFHSHGVVICLEGNKIIAAQYSGKLVFWNEGVVFFTY
jgi:hypothetical protein